MKLGNKLEVLLHFKLHQKFIEHYFELQKSFPQLEAFKKNVTLQFVFFSSIFVTSYIGSASFTAACCPENLLFSFQYQIMTMIVHAQSFQILIFSKMIEHKINLFTCIRIENLSKSGQKCLKKTIVKTFESVEKYNKIFSASMLLTLSWIYTSLLSNLHWIGIYFLGDKSANLTGK